MNTIIKSLLIMAVTTIAMPVGAQESNPLLADWTTKHETPPFEKIENQHYIPAIREAVKEAESNIKKITSRKGTPTFENTIVALETASQKLDRITNVLFNLNECNTDPEMQQIVMEITPELTRFSNSVSMNEKLFQKVKSVYDRRNQLGLTREQMMLVENAYKGFERNGVNLSKGDKKLYAQYSEELDLLSQKFNQNVLADNNSYILHITEAKDLSGLPQNVVTAAREEAQRRNLEGWVFTLAYPSYGPFLTYADNRDLREQIWKAYNSRGNRGGETDNNEVIRRMADLRYRQARLLGYGSYTEYVLKERMAETPEKLASFIEDLLNNCKEPAMRDLMDVQRFATKCGLKGAVQRWDFSYYSEKLKQKKYDFDAELLRPYFQLERVRQGIFDLYGRLYGLSFVEAPDIQRYHQDVKVYEVYDGSRFMGVLYLDMFPRESKRSGAWMTEFRGQSNLDGHQVRPLIQVVCNFSKPVGDKPALLSFDEVETFMHEFGHAMHGMLSDVTYPSLSGTNVYRDFVEMPSQVMENWCYESQFLNTFAKHYETGDTIPGEFIQKIKDSEKFMAGWLCLRQLCLGMVDMSFHSQTEPITIPIEQFEQGHMVELLPPVEGCNTSTAFTHIFAGGYASGYYGYKWAEVLDADIFGAFKKNGIFDKATAARFRSEILSKGGTEHPSVLFRNFMGRDPDQSAFLLRSGFIQPIMRER